MREQTYHLRSPGIRTEEVLSQIVAEDLQAQKKDKLARMFKDEQAKCPVYNPREGVDYSNILQQLGRPLPAADVETRLQRLNANLKFETNWNNPTKKACYFLNPDGKEFVCAYENGTMPEHSIMRVIEEELPDPDFFLGRAPLERNKMPAHEKVEDAESPFGFSYKFDPAAKRQGFKYEIKGFGEDRRGWRTLLCA
jgi:hypothetical protein